MSHMSKMLTGFIGAASFALILSMGACEPIDTRDAPEREPAPPREAPPAEPRPTPTPEPQDPAVDQDQQIHQEVQQHLQRQLGEFAHQINVQVEDGVVTLTGQVHSDQERNQAEDLAWQAEGVVDVDNQIEVDDMADEPY